jgi:hypothetical protein
MIECLICNRAFEKMISSTHLKTHGITSKQYKEQFPGASLVSEEEKLRASEHAKSINVKGIKRDPAIGCKQSETKKRKFALGELQACNKGLEMSEEQGMIGKLHSEETKIGISATMKSKRDSIRAVMEDIQAVIEDKGRWIPFDQLDDFSLILTIKRNDWKITF